MGRVSLCNTIITLFSHIVDFQLLTPVEVGILLSHINFLHKLIFPIWLMIAHQLTLVTNAHKAWESYYSY